MKYTQADLFDAPAGRAIGHRRAEDAAAHQEREVAEWNAEADRAFRMFAASMGETPFLTKQVRDASPWVPEPWGNKAWGAVAKRAQSDGYVFHVGHRQCKHSHGAFVSLWKWSGRKP